MKDRLLLPVLAFLLLPQVLPAQVVFSGSVSDAEKKSPLAHVNVLLKNGRKRVVKFTQTDGQGRFSVTLSEEAAARCDSIEFSLMSYRRQAFPLDGSRRTFDVSLAPTSIRIREVLVKARRIGEQGDTLTYNVASFADEQDRSIGDVLKKMPGIRVDDKGKISYNGTAINKFYIEGKDLLEGRYGIATKGISHKDVGRVEVLENHQPLRVLEGITYSDRAAINLKLKENVKGRWTGNAAAQGGYAEAEGEALWEADLLGMLIGKKVQNITTLKSNNTGTDLERDIRNLYRGSEEAASAGAEDYIRVKRSAAGSLEKKRTLLNRTHLLSASQLWETGGQWQLKTQLDYLDNRETRQRQTQTTYFLPDGSRLIAEDEQQKYHRHQLKFATTQEVNKKGHYLKHTVGFNLNWNDLDVRTGGTSPNRQAADQPVYQAGNSLSWVQRFGQNLLSLTSDNLFHAAPQQLDVQRAEGGLVSQRVETRLFHTHETVGYNWVFGPLVLALKGGVEGLARSLESRLAGVADSLGRTDNDLRTDYLQLYAVPQLSYTSPTWKVSLSASTRYSHYKLGGTYGRTDDWLFAPRLSVQWEATSRLSLYAGASLSPRSCPVGSFHEGAILTDYRTLRRGYPAYDRGSSRSVSGSLHYKHTLRELFGNVSLTRSWEETPFRGRQQFVGSYLVYTYDRQPSTSDSWLVMGDISKGLGFLGGGATLSGSWLRTHSLLTTEQTLVGYDSAMGHLSLDVNGRYFSWLSWLYRVSYRFSSLESTVSAKTRSDDWQHTFSLALQPAKGLTLTLSGEYYRNTVGEGVRKDLLLGDAKLGYKWKSYEVLGQVRNLFNQTDYSYTLYDDLSSVRRSLSIRGREFLVGFSWRK